MPVGMYSSNRSPGTVDSQFSFAFPCLFIFFVCSRASMYSSSYIFIYSIVIIVFMQGSFVHFLIYSCSPFFRSLIRSFIQVSIYLVIQLLSG